MTLKNFKDNKNLSYRTLAKMLGFSADKTYRLCKDKNTRVTLPDAVKIVSLTEGAVDFSDLLGDC